MCYHIKPKLWYEYNLKHMLYTLMYCSGDNTINVENYNSTTSTAYNCYYSETVKGG